MDIKILGTGCANCTKLEKVVREVVSELGLDANVKKVEDVQDIIAYGVMSTPGLVINDVVKVSGKVPSKAKVKELIEEALK